MKRIAYKVSALVLAFFVPFTVLAADGALSTFIRNIVQSIIQPIIFFLYALAFLLFVQGIGSYMLNAGNPKERAKGTQHILWGVVGFFIMTSVLLILRVLIGTFGITPPAGTF